MTKGQWLHTKATRWPALPSCLMVTGFWSMTFGSSKKGAFVPRGIIVEGVATMVILWAMIQPCVIVGKFFPREVEIRLENITGYGRSCQTALDFVLRNDALD